MSDEDPGLVVYMRAHALKRKAEGMARECAAVMADNHAAAVRDLQKMPCKRFQTRIGEQPVVYALGPLGQIMFTELT